MNTLDELLAKVTAESTQTDSLIELIGELRQQVNDALSGTLPPAVQTKVNAIFNAAQDHAAKLTAAINFVPTATKSFPQNGTKATAAVADPYVNALFCGVQWKADGSPIEITYSFPQDKSFYNGIFGGPYGPETDTFRALNPTQQDQVRAALKMIGRYAKIKFTEVIESLTVHATLRYAYSAAPSTAYCYFPSSTPQGGDTWFGTANGWYENFIPGTYAWTTLIHETGHGLGLKHPHDVSGSFGIMPVDKDCLEFTVMSYRSYIGASVTSGFTNAGDSYPQTWMMFDIAAIQAMYEINTETNKGATVYRWDAATGERFENGVSQGRPVGNKVFMTIWDAGGDDRLDLTNYGIHAAILPGNSLILSDAQRAVLGGGQIARGCVYNALNPVSAIEAST